MEGRTGLPPVHRGADYSLADPFTLKAENLPVVEDRELKPPINLPTSARARELAELGGVVCRCKWQQFGIRPNDRCWHMLIEGRTSMGKCLTTREQELKYQ
jgi:hypothetical protein